MAVVISHRLSTLRMADRIIVPGQGRVLSQVGASTRLRRAPLRSDRW